MLDVSFLVQSASQSVTLLVSQSASQLVSKSVQLASQSGRQLVGQSILISKFSVQTVVTEVRRSSYFIIFSQVNHRFQSRFSIIDHFSRISSILKPFLYPSNNEYQLILYNSLTESVCELRPPLPYHPRWDGLTV